MYVSKMPIRCVNLADEAELANHDAIVEKVRRMLSLKKQLAVSVVEKDDARHSLEPKIQVLDAEIDGLIYQLYGLTEEEIEIVEGK